MWKQYLRHVIRRVFQANLVYFKPPAQPPNRPSRSVLCAWPVCVLRYHPPCLPALQEINAFKADKRAMKIGLEMALNLRVRTHHRF